ncbi:hypothetical protein DITRI_Ditri18aG0014600 [Diplodiscus trichospermus]
MEGIRMKCNFHNGIGVDANGRSGGLALQRKEKVALQVISYSKNHIDAEAIDQQGSKWRLTGFYGEPNTNQHDSSWSLLRRLGSGNQGAWVCMGDFNEILWLTEKEGGRLKSDKQMKDFREALDDAGLCDLGFTGSRFTWKRRRNKQTLIKKRLDRATANSDWCNLFPDFKVTHLISSRSDHCPLLLDTEGNMIRNKFRGRRRRNKFEVMWLKEMEAQQIIEDVWSCASWDLKKKMNGVANRLKKWSDLKFHNLRDKVDKLTNELEMLRSNGDKDEELMKEEHLCVEIDDLLQKEESFWMQRAKINWLHAGGKHKLSPRPSISAQKDEFHQRSGG